MSAQIPLSDCTATALQDANVPRYRKAYQPAPAVIIPKTFSHNPYHGVLPSTVDEMIRVLESRRQQQNALRRTMSSPQLFPYAPMSPMMPVVLSRVPSAPIFFEEPEIRSRNNSIVMANESMISVTSEYIQTPSTKPLQPARVPPVTQKPQMARSTLSHDVSEAKTPALPAPEDQNSSSDSIVLTKVYQNGRPVPRVRQEAEVKALLEASDEPTPIEVKFRHRTGVFKAAGIQLRTGQHVIVDGDRGMDLGIVSDLAQPTEQNTIQGSIQRLATDKEVDKYATLEMEEAKVLEFAQNCAQRHLNNKLAIEKVGFQFDKQKLTLWYRAAERVYFVPLLKALNQQYKCRIWMERIEE